METRKKAPLNTELIRCIRKTLQVSELQEQSIRISPVWAGLLSDFSSASVSRGY